MKTTVLPSVTVRKTRSVANPRQWIYEFAKGGIVRATVVGCGGGLFRLLDRNGSRAVTESGEDTWERRPAMLEAYVIAEAAS